MGEDSEDKRRPVETKKRKDKVLRGKRQEKAKGNRRDKGATGGDALEQPHNCDRGFPLAEYLAPEPKAKLPPPLVNTDELPTEQAAGGVGDEDVRAGLCATHSAGRGVDQARRT